MATLFGQNMATPINTFQLVKLYKDYVELNLANGLKKVITIEDFKHALDKSLNIQVKLDYNLLPPNCYLFGKSVDKAVIGCYYTGEIREIQYLSDKSSGRLDKYKIPFPNIIITTNLTKAAQKWTVASVQFFSTIKTIGQLPTTPIESSQRSNGIWSLALPNMYADGKMCYGHNSVPYTFVDDNFKGLDWYYRLLYNSPFNSDLHVPEVRETPENWIKKLSKLEKFPYEVLPEYRNTLEAQSQAVGTVVTEAAAQRVA